MSNNQTFTQGVSVNPKSQGVNGSSVFHGAGRLEEGGGVRWSEAPGAQQDDPGCLGLLLLGEVKEHAWNGDEFFLKCLSPNAIFSRPALNHIPLALTSIR